MTQPRAVQKEPSMLLQKELIGGHYDALARARDQGKKVVYTFVPGNLTELLRSFDLLPVLPEINALQSAMRNKSAGYIAAAEKGGHSEDVCTYVKCDIGMLRSGNIGPTDSRVVAFVAITMSRAARVHPRAVRPFSPFIRSFALSSDRAPARRRPSVSCVQEEVR